MLTNETLRELQKLVENIKLAPTHLAGVSLLGTLDRDKIELLGDYLGINVRDSSTIASLSTLISSVRKDELETEWFQTPVFKEKLHEIRKYLKQKKLDGVEPNVEVLMKGSSRASTKLLMELASDLTYSFEYNGESDEMKIVVYDLDNLLHSLSYVNTNKGIIFIRYNGITTDIWKNKIEYAVFHEDIELAKKRVNTLIQGVPENAHSLFNSTPQEEGISLKSRSGKLNIPPDMEE